MLTLLILYVAGGILLTGLSIPLILRKIKPNGLYGFRVPQTLADPDLWYAVNAHAGKRLLFTGIIDVVAALGFYFIPEISVDVYALACLGVMVVVMGCGIAQSFFYMKKFINSI